ncbi:Glycoprotein-N-acetylgalactosamine 3-beta-galactosyltransferase 1 [Diplonema papillatum]|nr:Glycoprotein-N-acetylgalactosamine 3-beta-galactosyltransferase 1 [Diplonema papillatum]
MRRATRIFLVLFFTFAVGVWLLLLFQLDTNTSSATTFGAGCTDDADECAQWAQEGQCDGIQATTFRRTCRLSCGVCVGPAGPKKMFGVLGKSTARELAKLYRGAFDIKLVANSFASDKELQSVLSSTPSLWKKTTLGSLCTMPAATAEGSAIVKKVKRMSPPLNAPRVLCMIYTTEKNHKTRIEAQRRTWAKGCDGWVAMSTVFDPRIPSLDVPHEGPEQWDNMWQKARSMWAWANATQAGSYDFFYMAGDDVYLDTLNFKSYLATLPKDQPLYIGRRLLEPNSKTYFNAGGAGYTLNRRALALLAASLDDAACEAHGKFFWEDVNVAQCLRRAGVVPLDTRDAAGAERFHPLSPDHLAGVKKSDWLFSYSTDYKLGKDGVSDESISFHYLSPEVMRGIHTALTYCTVK